MGAFLYGVSLQWKLDMRSKTLLITCYIVPLLFFAIMGGIFTSVMPEARYTLIQSMTVFGVTMGALIGLPPSLVEIYSSDIKKVYKANGVPLYLGLALTNISAYIHLFLMSIILYIAAPLVFDAEKHDCTDFATKFLQKIVGGNTFRWNMIRPTYSAEAGEALG